MRLNGAPLNGAALNGRNRVRVALAGDATASITGALTPIRIRRGNASAPISIVGQLPAMAIRQGAGAVSVVYSAAISPSALRSAKGDAVVSLAASLFYTRTILGSGDAIIAFLADSSVGVVFGEGQAALLSVIAEATGLRKRFGAGVGTVSVVSDLAPSAIRRPATAEADLLAKLTAVLEPSHITSGGVRYVGAFGELPVILLAEDAGMLRQALLGSMDMEMLAATGTLTVIRSTLAGSAINTLTMEGTSYALRRGAGSAVSALIAQCTGEIMVRGDGQMILPILAIGSGTAYRPTLAGSFPVSLETACEFARGRVGRGDAIFSIAMSGEGVRKRTGEGDLIIQALEFGGGVINPFRDDNDRDEFRRPRQPREFRRPATTREFRR